MKLLLLVSTIQISKIIRILLIFSMTAFVSLSYITSAEAQTAEETISWMEHHYFERQVNDFDESSTVSFPKECQIQFSVTKEPQVDIRPGSLSQSTMNFCEAIKYNTYDVKYDDKYLVLRGRTNTCTKYYHHAYNGSCDTERVITLKFLTEGHRDRMLKALKHLAKISDKSAAEPF